MTPPTPEDELDALTAELVQVQDQLLAMYDLSRTIRGHMEPQSLLVALMSEAIRLVHAAGGFALLEEDGHPPVVARSEGVALERQLLQDLVRDPQGDGAWPSGLVQRVTPLGRLLLVPLSLREHARAVLGLLRPPDHRFMAPDEKLAAAIASQAAAQLDGVLLYQASLRRQRMELEFDLARSIQQGLTPPVPTQCVGLDVFAESRAASIVGGDFFDFVASREGPLLCTFGDVAGKGIPAAMLVAMTRASVRAAARAGRFREPARVLERANADLEQDYGRLSLFATVLLACFEAAEGVLTLANAGHSPVMYRPAGGAARLVRADAPPLGVLEHWDGGDLSLPLGPGDALVVATDGFSEAENARSGEMFGYDRLLALVDRTAGQPAAEVGATFFEAVDAFCAGATAGDDQTLLVVRRLG